MFGVMLVVGNLIGLEFASNSSPTPTTTGGGRGIDIDGRKGERGEEEWEQTIEETTVE